MPLKDKLEYNNYLKQYRRNKTEIGITKRNYDLVIQEFKSRSILPRHIYEFRFVMKELLKCYFKKK